MSCRTVSNASGTTVFCATAIAKASSPCAANSWGCPQPASSRRRLNPTTAISTKNSPEGRFAIARSATLGIWWRSPSFPSQIGHRPVELDEISNLQFVPSSLRLLPPSQQRGHVHGTKATTTFDAVGGFSALTSRLPDQCDSTLEKDQPPPKRTAPLPRPCPVFNHSPRRAPGIQYP
jgi:hypothetical protein